MSQGCATFFVGGPYNQLQISNWATDAHTNMNHLSTVATQSLIRPAFLVNIELPRQVNT